MPEFARQRGNLSSGHYDLLPCYRTLRDCTTCFPGRDLNVSGRSPGHGRRPWESDGHIYPCHCGRGVPETPNSTTVYVITSPRYSSPRKESYPERPVRLWCETEYFACFRDSFNNSVFIDSLKLCVCDAYCSSSLFCCGIGSPQLGPFCSWSIVTSVSHARRCKCFSY